MEPENDTGTSGNDANLSASQILKRMAETYASAATYQDTGCVRTTFTHTDKVTITEKPFTTAFVRPDRFRFEYNEKDKSGWTREIVWRQGEKVKTAWNVTHFKPTVLTRIMLCLLRLLRRLILGWLSYHKQPDSRLDVALGGATGVSGGSAHNIPSLLWPEHRSGFRLTDLTEAVRLADETYDSVKCFCVHGQYCGRSTLLSIDCVTFLVRRIEEQYTLRRVRTACDVRTDVHIEQVTTYKSIIGQTIDPRLLAFDAA